AVAVFARTNLLQSIPGIAYEKAPGWFKNWEDTGLIAWVDKNGDGKIQYDGSGAAFVGKPTGKDGPDARPARSAGGERLWDNAPTANSNELYIDRDIMVLANPEIAKLPSWVIGLVAAGGLAAALSTAAGLLLVISTSVAHDLVKKTFHPDITEKGELIAARIAAGGAVVVAGYFGINPPGFVAQVVAFAFGLAASSFFPAIILGIFSKRINVYGAISGMVVGIVFTASYIIYFKFINPADNVPENWLWEISPEGIGTVGMILNFIVAIGVSLATPRPPEAIRTLVDRVRYPRKAMAEEGS
ncbi:MAG: VC_2705 family sodium/solute symporter, partial [Akkermansiaceae bacterium]|nr:VC_2705 family sodium/solute symporter [Akkermansiaceae bacterium]